MINYRKSGFTLFELLITMTTISVILGVGYYSMAKSTNDRALERAADTLHSMVRIARTQAITNGVHSRLIINADQGDPESYLRRIGVVIQDDSTDGKWIAVERGALLPVGVCVVPQGGAVNIPSGLPKSIYRKLNGDGSDDTAVFNFEYPLRESVHEGTVDAPTWIAIQFAPNGRLSTAVWGGGGLVPLSNQLIVSKGSWNGSEVGFGEANEFRGIAFKIGGSSYTSNEAALFEVEEEELEVVDD